MEIEQIFQFLITHHRRQVKTACQQLGYSFQVLAQRPINESALTQQQISFLEIQRIQRLKQLCRRLKHVISGSFYSDSNLKQLLNNFSSSGQYSETESPKNTQIFVSRYVLSGFDKLHKQKVALQKIRHANQQYKQRSMRYYKEKVVNGQINRLRSPSIKKRTNLSDQLAQQFKDTLLQNKCLDLMKLNQQGTYKAYQSVSPKLQLDPIKNMYHKNKFTLHSRGGYSPLRRNILKNQRKPKTYIEKNLSNQGKRKIQIPKQVFVQRKSGLGQYQKRKEEFVRKKSEGGENVPVVKIVLEETHQTDAGVQVQISNSQYSLSSTVS